MAVCNTNFGWPWRSLKSPHKSVCIFLSFRSERTCHPTIFPLMDLIITRPPTPQPPSSKGGSRHSRLCPNVAPHYRPLPAFFSLHFPIPCGVNSFKKRNLKRCQFFMQFILFPTTYGSTPTMVASDHFFSPKSYLQNVRDSPVNTHSCCDGEKILKRNEKKSENGNP